MENLRSAVSGSVDVSVFDTSAHRSVGRAGQWSVANATSALGLIPRYRRALRRARPDVVHIETGGYLGPLKSALLLLAAGTTPTVLSVHSPHIDRDLKAAGRAGGKIVLRALMRAAVIRVEHRGQARDIRALHRGLADAQIHVIPNLTNVDAIPVASHAADPGNPFVLVTVGSVGARKGTYDLLRAVALVTARHPAMECRILGPEERPGDLAALHALRASLGLDGCVTFTGSTGHDDVLRALGSAHAFTLPAYAEGVPLAILEAMAAGLPVLVTDVGGIAEVVHQPEIGFVSPGDPDGLAAAILRLIADPGLRARCGRANRQHVSTTLAPAKLGATFVRSWEQAAGQRSP